MHRLLILLLLPLVLTDCGGTFLTYADVAATAQITGCWPDPWPTPNPQPVSDVQPIGIGATPTVDASAPTATILPTTTPYPRCSPPPGATAVVWPTRFPTRPPFPTMEPALVLGGSDTTTTMHLPGRQFDVKLAVHPTEGWPALVTMSRFVASTDPMQITARVYNPHTGTWNVAQQVDVGASSAGQDRFGSAVIGITGDRTVHVVWGSSDEGQQRIWTSQSTDFGVSWSEPVVIATGCWQPVDMATSVDNQIAVLLACYPGRPSVVVRRGNGTWLPQQWPGTKGQFGAIRIVGEGSDARAVAVMSELQDTRQVDILSKRLSDGGAWQVQMRRVPSLPNVPPALLWQQEAVLFPRPNSATPGILVTWPGFEASIAYALTSLDGGQTWGEVETIVASTQGARVNRVVPAYDAAADRLVAIWTCCGNPKEESSHYASWSVSGSGLWSPALAPDLANAVPLVLGARAADDMSAAQALNSRTTWLAWVEREHQIEVRSFDLNKVVPVDQYPQPTPTATRSTP